MTARGTTDRRVGLGLAFSIVALVAALATGVFGYRGALAHEGGGGAQMLSGLAFGVAVLVGGLAIVAIHVYAE